MCIVTATNRIARLYLSVAIDGDDASLPIDPIIYKFALQF